MTEERQYRVGEHVLVDATVSKELDSNGEYSLDITGPADEVNIYVLPQSVHPVLVESGWNALRQGDEILPVDPDGVMFATAFADDVTDSRLLFEINRAQRSVDARRAVLALREAERAAAADQASHANRQVRVRLACERAFSATWASMDSVEQQSHLWDAGRILRADDANRAEGSAS